MNAESVARLLHGKRWKPGNYVARCPAHDDRNSSLSISEGETGVLLHCFAGCRTDDILAAAGLRYVDLFYDSKLNSIQITAATEKLARIKPVTDDDLGRVKRKYNGGNGGGWKEVTRYRYTSAAGVLLAEKIRLEPKDFRWRNAQTGEWSKPKDCPIYNLHKIAKASLVIVTEGEKDCDSLSCYGFTATTTPNGAASWRPEYAEPLRGKTVLLCTDNDAAGEQYRIDVANSLFGIAKYINVLQVPLEHKDVSDWTRQGAAPRAELDAAIAEALPAPREVEL